MQKNITVYASGKLIFNGKEYKCVVGKGGLTKDKKEGDESTPVGCFLMREVFYRSDKVKKPQTVLPIRELQKNHGWCDDSSDEKYNKFVELPHTTSHEKLWREDEVYDVIIPLGYNDNPAIPGKGSAIFMHVARPTYSPTAGCIALSENDIIELLSSVSTETQVCIVSE